MVIQSMIVYGEAKVPLSWQKLSNSEDEYRWYNRKGNALMEY